MSKSDYIKSRVKELSIPESLPLIIKISQVLNITKLVEAMLVAAFIIEVNYRYGTALVVSESFIEILSDKEPEEILEAFNDDEKLEKLEEFVVNRLDELKN